MLGKHIAVGLLLTVLITGVGCSNDGATADQRAPETAAPAVGASPVGAIADSAWRSPSDPGVPGREDNMGVGAGSSVNTPDSARRP